MRFARLLLAALLAAPLLVAQEEDCPETFPPETCDEGGIGVTPIPPPPITCPCALGGDLETWIQAECVAQPNQSGSPPRVVNATCSGPPPGDPHFAFLTCDPGGVFPPNNMIIAQAHTTNLTCDFIYASCPGLLPCTPSTDFDSGVLPVTAAELAVCDALISGTACD